MKKLNSWKQFNERHGKNADVEKVLNHLIENIDEIKRYNLFEKGEYGQSLRYAFDLIFFEAFTFNFYVRHDGRYTLNINGHYTVEKELGDKFLNLLLEKGIEPIDEYHPEKNV